MTRRGHSEGLFLTLPALAFVVLVVAVGHQHPTPPAPPTVVVAPTTPSTARTTTTVPGTVVCFDGQGFPIRTEPIGAARLHLRCPTERTSP